MPQDILITPYKDSTSSGAKIDFTGFNSGASTITMRILPDSTLSYEGTAGQLFSISNGLSSGTIFSVNDISGIPSIDVASSGLVRLAPFVGEVQTNKLYVQANPQSGTQTVQEWRNLSGTAMASVNTSGQFAGYLASGTGVGGSSGQMQFNAGGTIGGSAAVTFISGHFHLNVNAQATNIVPIRVQGFTSQTANLQEWQDSAGNSLMAVVPGATLVFAANTPNISGTVSNLVTSGSYYVRLNCTWSGSALTGIAPPTGLSQVDGKIMRLINAGTQPMKLTNMATSTATNRFACYNSGDLWMSPNDYYECTYDSTTFNGTSSGGAWRVHA